MRIAVGSLTAEGIVGSVSEYVALGIVQLGLVDAAKAVVTRVRDDAGIGSCQRGCSDGERQGVGVIVVAGLAGVRVGGGQRTIHEIVDVGGSGASGSDVVLIADTL